MSLSQAEMLASVTESITCQKKRAIEEIRRTLEKSSLQFQADASDLTDNKTLSLITVLVCLPCGWLLIAADLPPFTLQYLCRRTLSHVAATKDVTPLFIFVFWGGISDGPHPFSLKRHDTSVCGCVSYGGLFNISTG